MAQTVRQQLELPPAIFIEGLGEGTLLRDSIIGSLRGDTITALSGDDTVFALDANDALLGGELTVEEGVAVVSLQLLQPALYQHLQREAAS